MPRTRSGPRGAAGAATPQDPMRHLGLVHQLALRFHFDELPAEFIRGPNWEDRHRRTDPEV